jgi:hypothetical protein
LVGATPVIFGCNTRSDATSVIFGMQHPKWNKNTFPFQRDHLSKMSVGMKRAMKHNVEEVSIRAEQAVKNMKEACDGIECMELLLNGGLPKDVRTIVLVYLVQVFQTMSNIEITYLLPNREEGVAEFLPTEWYIIGHLQRDSALSFSQKISLSVEKRVAMSRMFCENFLLAKVGSAAVTQTVSWIDMLEHHQGMLGEAKEWLEIAYELECDNHRDGWKCGGKIFDTSYFMNSYSSISKFVHDLKENKFVISSGDRSFISAQRRLLKTYHIGCPFTGR